MTTADDFVWALEQYIGYHEQPMGSNNVPGITDRSGCNASWCAWCNMTVSVALSDAGIEHNQWSVVNEVVNAKNGVRGFRWISDPYAGVRGDFVVINWPGGGQYDHIEGLVAVQGYGDYHTIGGNVSDRCDDQRRTVKSGYIAGFVRPPYDLISVPVMPDQPIGGVEVEYKDCDAVWDPNNAYHVVARGSDNHAWTNTWAAVVGWSGWSKINDGLLLGSPKISVGPGGRLDLIGVGQDSAIWHCWKPAGQGWSAWHSLGGISG